VSGEISTMRTAGIVLCGGQSRRMGRAKAWLPFAGELLLPRMVRLLREVVDPVVVVAAAGQELPPLPSAVAVVRDEQPGRGPLQGLTAGLAALRGQADAAYASSCDVPFLRPAFVRRLIDLIGANLICAPEIGGYRHPLAALYRLDVAPVVARLLAEDRLRAAQLFEEVPTRFVQPEELADVDPSLQSVRNLNTPEEYEAALREIGGSITMTRQSEPQTKTPDKPEISHGEST
jgi:molybdopterin-guanine dinucleotide biosynthesis protein A